MDRQAVVRALTEVIHSHGRAQTAADSGDLVTAYAELAAGLVGVRGDLTRILLADAELAESMERHPAGSAVGA